MFVLCSRVFNAMLSLVRGGGADSEAIAFKTFVKIILIIKTSCLFSVYSVTTNVSPPKSNMEFHNQFVACVDCDPHYVCFNPLFKHGFLREAGAEWRRNRPSTCE